MLIVKASALKTTNNRTTFDDRPFSGVGMAFKDGWLSQANVYTEGELDFPYHHVPIYQTKRTDYVDAEILVNEGDQGYCYWLDLPQYIKSEPFGGVAFAFDNQGRCSDEFGFNSDGTNAYEIMRDSRGEPSEVSINSEQACELYKFNCGNICEIQITERIAVGYNTHALTIRYNADGKVETLHLNKEYFIFRKMSKWKPTLVTLPRNLEELSKISMAHDAIITGTGADGLK